jgi:hypothetical protein
MIEGLHGLFVEIRGTCRLAACETADWQSALHPDSDRPLVIKGWRRCFHSQTSHSVLSSLTPQPLIFFPDIHSPD